MFRKMFSYGGVPLLAAAVALATPASGRAAHGGGGGHFGGAHFGGAHFGGAHFGGAHFGGAYFGGAHLGAWHGNFYGGGYGRARDHAAYGYRGGYRHYGTYGYYPYYYPYYGSYPYTWWGPGYDSGYSSGGGDVTPSYPDDYASGTPSAASYQSYYPSATITGDATAAQPDSKAHVTLNVPADAEVWFEGTRTTTAGAVRHYESPPLTPMRWYTYEVRARWDDHGHEVTQTQQIEVTAGTHVDVKFPVPPKTTGKTSAAK
jgi:uncharacterized protein (TIGR03000 family)